MNSLRSEHTTRIPRPVITSKLHVATTNQESRAILLGAGAASTAALVATRRIVLALGANLAYITHW